MTKALVTGGAGFIGTHLAQRLARGGYRVDLVDNFSRGANDETIASLVSAGSVRLIERDLLQPGALEDADQDYDLIVHLAAIVGVANVLARAYNVLSDNAAMTATAISVARRQHALKRFLFASTSEVYAGTLEHFTLPLPTPETTPLTVPAVGHPRTSYMLSKIYGEAMCHASGLPFTIFRPHNVYGPRMGLAHVIPELLERAHFATDGRLEVFSVDHRRTFCYVEDAVEMLVRVAESPQAEGETLNIGVQEPEIAIGELATLVTRVVGKELELVPLPATPGSPSRRCPDMAKTTELTSYKPAVSLEEGVRRTYEAYVEGVFDRAQTIAR